jgi:hypothetical protein
MACKQRDWTTLKLTLVNVSNRCTHADQVNENDDAI